MNPWEAAFLTIVGVIALFFVLGLYFDWDDRSNQSPPESVTYRGATYDLRTDDRIARLERAMDRVLNEWRNR